MAGELLQDLGGTSQTIAGLTDANVDAQLANAKSTHRVLALILGLFLLLLHLASFSGGGLGWRLGLILLCFGSLKKRSLSLYGG